MTLGEKIKFLRERTALTQEQLGKMIGYNFRVISKWEKDISVPNANVIYQLAKIFDEPIENMLNENFDYSSSTSSEEILDILQEDGRKTGFTASKQKIHEKGLWHRESLSFVCNNKGQLLTYKRVETTKIHPGLVVPYFGGHVLSGESYEDAVKRELEEEIGITATSFELLQQTKGVS